MTPKTRKLTRAKRPKVGNPEDGRCAARWDRWNPAALRLMRNVRMMSIEYLADKVGCSPRAISAYESSSSRKSTPTAARAQEIADALEVPLRALGATRVGQLPKDMELT